MHIDTFKKLPVLGILRGISSTDLAPLLEIIIESGLKIIEITLNTENAIKLIQDAVKISSGRLSIGAGTVLSKKNAQQAVDAGAEFIVTPGLIEEVTTFCRKNKIPFFPGALTPTEVYKAWNEGAAMVKVFPASAFGPGYFRELKGPFDNIELMAVGGVTSENLGDFFKNGASAVAFGASIFKPDWLRKSDFLSIKNAINEFISSCHRSKKSLTELHS